MSNRKMSDELIELALRLHVEEGWRWARIVKRLNQWTHHNFQWGTYVARGGELRREWIRQSLELMRAYAEKVLP